MMTGTISIHGFFAYALFDSGAMHSFVSRCFESKLIVTPVKLDCDLFVATPFSVSMYASFMSKSCEVYLGNESYMST